MKNYLKKNIFKKKLISGFSQADYQIFAWEICVEGGGQEGEFAFTCSGICRDIDNGLSSTLYWHQVF